MKKVLHSEKRIVADDTPLDNEYAQGDVIITSAGVIKIKGATTFSTLGDLSQISGNNFTVATPSVTSYTANANEYVLLDVGTIKANITITLPNAPSLGDWVIIKNTSGQDAYSILAQKGNSNQQIDGGASWEWSVAYSTVKFVYLQANRWYVESLYHPGLGMA